LPLLCNVGEAHGKEAFAIDGIAVRPLPCVITRQSFYRTYMTLYHVNSCTAKSCFSVVVIIGTFLILWMGFQRTLADFFLDDVRHFTFYAAGSKEN
jgi:hypothetical protein